MAAATGGRPRACRRLIEILSVLIVVPLLEGAHLRIVVANQEIRFNTMRLSVTGMNFLRCGIPSRGEGAAAGTSMRTVSRPSESCAETPLAPGLTTEGR
jgi:hypothetical protein